MSKHLCPYFHPCMNFFLYEGNTFDTFKETLTSLYPTLSLKSLNEALTYCQTYSNPPKILKYTASKKPSILIPSIDCEGIQTHLSNPQRFAKPMLVFIDRHFLTDKHIEKIQSLQNKQMHVILLVQHFTDDLIDYFNEGIIHRVINLSEITTIEQQKHFIMQATMDCFQDRLFTFHLKPHADTLIPFYQNYFRENQVCEYYALDFKGSYLTLDEKANAKLIIITTTEQQHQMIDSLSMHSNVDSRIIDDLKNFKYLPFVSPNESILSKLSEDETINIHSFLHPCSQINDSNLYYAEIHPNQLERSHFLPKNIVSFYDYMHKTK